MKGALLAMVLLSTTIKPDEQVGIIEFTVDSVSVNGGVTTVTATFTNRGTLPTVCAHPDLMYKDAAGKWQLELTSNKFQGNLIGRLKPNVSRQVRFTYNRTGEKLLFYGGGFRGQTRTKAVDIP